MGIADKFDIPADGKSDPFADIKKKSGLDYFGEAFEFFLIFGDLENFKKVGRVDYAYCLDVPFHFDSRYPFLESIFRDITEHNPIAILINPYMSQRDIIDYVKKAYSKEIKPIQLAYENKLIKLGGVRSKSEKITKRDNFIWKHKNKPLRKIALLLGENNLEIIDVGLIAKIISLREKEEAKRTSLNS